jgi:hypothetical protein
LLDAVFLSRDSLIDCIDLFVEVRYSVLLIAILSLRHLFFLQVGQPVMESVDASDKAPFRLANGQAFS